MQLREPRIQTGDLPITRRPTLPPQLQLRVYSGCWHLDQRLGDCSFQLPEADRCPGLTCRASVHLPPLSGSFLTGTLKLIIGNYGQQVNVDWLNLFYHISVNNSDYINNEGVKIRTLDWSYWSVDWSLAANSAQHLHSCFRLNVTVRLSWSFC